MKRNPIAAAEESLPQKHARAHRIAAALKKGCPDAGTALKFDSPFQLLIATILSAQCTDEKVNQVTPVLFGRFPDARSLAAADRDEVEKIIHATGFYRQKARGIIECSRALAEHHGGKVPESMEDLTALPSVGRKTANVIRANAMDLPGFIVDTHVKRVSGRLGLTRQTDPEKIEEEMTALLPESEWSHFSSALIWHGRRICQARKPLCEKCFLAKDCAYGRAALGS